MHFQKKVHVIFETPCISETIEDEDIIGGIYG